MGLIFSELIAFYEFRIFSTLNVVGISFMHVRFYQFHQSSLVCDHHELACTPKDPPRRFDMIEMSLICFQNKKYWVIDKTVWKLALVELLENRICVFISWSTQIQYIQYIVSMLGAIGRYLGAIDCYLAAAGPLSDCTCSIPWPFIALHSKLM